MVSKLLDTTQQTCEVHETEYGNLRCRHCTLDIVAVYKGPCVERTVMFREVMPDGTATEWTVINWCGNGNLLFYGLHPESPKRIYALDKYLN